MRPGCIEGWQVVQNVELIVRDYHVYKIVLATSIDLFLCQIEWENTLDVFAVAVQKTEDF